MQKTTTRPYRGVSAADRRAKRRAALLEAGLDLLGTKGWSGTTVRAVCAHAGLTERYFYESFADREALLLAVFDEIIGEATRVVLEAVEAAPHDARAKSRAAIAAFVELLTEDPRKGHTAFVEAMGSEGLMQRRLDTLRGFAALIAEQGRAFYGKSAVTREDAELTAFVLVGGLAETLIAWLRGEIDVSRDRLVDHCAEVFVSAASVSSAAR
jgi:AcrR family transcriptional regulator